MKIKLIHMSHILEGSRRQYSEYYKGIRSDSPSKSRLSLLKRLRDYSNVFSRPHGYLLDLGSGPQILEHEYPGVSKTPLPFFVTTLDNSDI